MPLIHIYIHISFSIHASRRWPVRGLFVWLPSDCQVPSAKYLANDEHLALGNEQTNPNLPSGLPSAWQTHSHLATVPSAFAKSWFVCCLPSAKCQVICQVPSLGLFATCQVKSAKCFAKCLFTDKPRSVTLQRMHSA